MKTLIKTNLFILGLGVFFVAGCNDAKKVSEESLGLRKTNLYKESNKTTGEKTEYGTNYPGTSKRIKRAFQDAPPMIPHSVEGLLPITIDNHMCKGCHMPAVAPGVGSTPIPRSHFMDFRPKTAIEEDGTMTKDGIVLKNTSTEKLDDLSIKKLTKLSGTRYNCTQCHAPQSKGQLVENTFEADYKAKDGANRSSWSGIKLTDGLNTLEDK